MKNILFFIFYILLIASFITSICYLAQKTSETFNRETERERIYFRIFKE